MLRVNGLFGWIEANDRRSLLLFAGFLAAFHVATVLALYLPLAAFDPDHAPVFTWAGYASRYLVVVTLGGALLFAGLLLWHVHTVRKIVAFTFVDEQDEPRLCRIVEPLAISMGLPAPYVGVIPSGALNAFACGIRRKDAVVVVTRGLIDGLDDEELSAVVAHELAHIRNGDIRLMAAANVCLRLLNWLIAPRMKPTTPLRELVSLPILSLWMPPVLVFVLIVNFVAQSALKAGRLVRLLISSSREFVADAVAVEVTQNPAALVSALRKVHGNSAIAGLPPGQDAMMIDGAAEGMLATHPSMDERVRAVVAVTGSMALVAPRRRDTRPDALRETQGAVHATAELSGHHRTPRPISALRRVEAGDDRNWLGLTRNMSYGAILAVAVVIGCHAQQLDRPAALLEAFDPRPFNVFLAAAAKGIACNAGAIASMIHVPGLAQKCDPQEMSAFLSAQSRNAGPLGAMLATMAETPSGTFSSAGTDRKGKGTR
ncbi:M48 family metalloprotease [uncultured Methylobacterium sp.]|uniref:M48 family metalloprotease n=1 Tax=uncultured Methylobacterium sp. TaxID=157278 RepID=UPI002592DD78|nr:M48 family metalloprotease [uncultured Methylobacterium sp.]